MPKLSFNPCFVGDWSVSFAGYGLNILFDSFNPCFVGDWSVSLLRTDMQITATIVSILVLLEIGL